MEDFLLQNDEMIYSIESENYLMHDESIFDLICRSDQIGRRTL